MARLILKLSDGTILGSVEVPSEGMYTHRIVTHEGKKYTVLLSDDISAIVHPYETLPYKPEFEPLN